MNKERERFDRTVKSMMEVMSKKSLAQLVASFMMLEAEYINLEAEQLDEDDKDNNNG